MAESSNTSKLPKLPKSSKLSEEQIIRRLSTIGIGGNIALSAFKLAAGILGNSGAMISDAVHSMSDVVATFIAMIGVKLSKRGADDEHPYGHERLECIAAVLLALILLVTGLSIGKVGVDKIIGGDYASLPAPGTIALIAAVVSIVVKEGMFWYTRHYARIIGSSAFEADAWHHRSDALSSIGALIGIGGSMLGFPIMDAIASVVICIFILKVAIEVMIDAVKKLLDTSADRSFEDEVRAFVEQEPGVERIDLLHTRMFGDKIYVDLEIAIDGTMPLSDAHAIAERVHEDIEKNFPVVKHVMVHMNPA